MTGIIQILCQNADPYNVKSYQSILTHMKAQIVQSRETSKVSTSRLCAWI